MSNPTPPAVGVVKFQSRLLSPVLSTFLPFGRPLLWGAVVLAGWGSVGSNSNIGAQQLPNRLPSTAATASASQRIELSLSNRKASEVASALESLVGDDVQLLVNPAKNSIVLEGTAQRINEFQRLVHMMDGQAGASKPSEAKFLPPFEPNKLPQLATQQTTSGESYTGGTSVTQLPPAMRGSVQNASAESTANNEQKNRWVYVAAGDHGYVQKRFGELLKNRIQADTSSQKTRFLINAGQRNGNVEFDLASETLAIGGDAQLVLQLTTLVQQIQNEQAGRGTRLVSASRATAASINGIRARLVANDATLKNAQRNQSTQPQLFQASNIAANSQGATQTVRPASFLGPMIQQDGTNLESLPKADQDDPQKRTLPDFGGNIDVEMLPDLDVLILRGRDQDLEQLADIVRELEAISKDTQPEIEVYHLQHSSASAMSALIQQVNPDLVRGRQGRVTVTSIEKPNALLLIGWGAAVEATKELIAKLDHPVDPASQFKIFRLTQATAAGVQTTLQQFIDNRPGLANRARLITDNRTNSIIVAAAPRDLVEITELIQQLDIPNGMAKSRAEVIQPKHMLAADLAETLQLTINAIQQGDQRSGILELLTIDAEGAETIRSGALRNVTITAQPRNNAILVSAPAHSLSLIKSLIDQLDQPSSTAQMKIFRIVNSEAASIVQVLRSLLPSETATGQPFRLPNSGNATSLVPLRFSIDPRTNSVLAIGNPADLNVVEALVLRLDEEGGLERKSVVYHLKNAPARDIAAAINEFLLNQRQLNLASPGSVNPYQQLEQEVIIVPEPVGNRLILSATQRYFEEISLLIKKLDEAPPQVMIQVLIAEVTLNNADEFGIELGIQDSVLFDRSLLGDLLTTVNTTTTSTASGVVTVTEEIVQSATNEPGFNFNTSSALGNSGSDKSLATSKDIGGQGLSNFSVGRVNSELGFGGLVLSASGRNVSALLRALQESRRLEILSRPQIRSLDNQPAYIQVGQRVPRIIGSTVNQNGQTNTVALENVGLIMGVTPRISPDGTVVMEVDAEKSQLGPENEGIPVSVSSDGTVIRSPRIDTTTAQTTVSAASGETIVLGGLITKSDQQIHRKVPWLGDIPVLKNLFRFDSNIGKRTELVIILTPHVIRSPLDNDRIREIELARMSWCAADVYEIHGDVKVGQDYFDLDAETEIIYPDGAAVDTLPTPLHPSALED